LTLSVKIGRQTTIVQSLQSASDEWCKYRNSLELGASESPAVWVFSDGKKIARVSYNGRIWALDGKEILPQEVPTHFTTCMRKI
jgi:hypothetical protein